MPSSRGRPPRGIAFVFQKLRELFMLSIAVLLRGRPDQLYLVIKGFQLGKVLLRLVKLGLKRFIFRCNAR